VLLILKAGHNSFYTLYRTIAKNFIVSTYFTAVSDIFLLETSNITRADLIAGCTTSWLDCRIIGLQLSCLELRPVPSPTEVLFYSYSKAAISLFSFFSVLSLFSASSSCCCWLLKVLSSSMVD
jgi:hypothetical protein